MTYEKREREGERQREGEHVRGPTFSFEIDRKLENMEMDTRKNARRSFVALLSYKN